jgi:hypothetical protein
MIRIAMIAAIALTAISAGTASYASTTDGFNSALNAPITLDRSKPRVKGGSGCDDPRDKIEHPECR